jgi:hypothetical protein
MCGGSGLASDAVAYLRERWLEAQLVASEHATNCKPPTQPPSSSVGGGTLRELCRVLRQARWEGMYVSPLAARMLLAAATAWADVELARAKVDDDDGTVWGLLEDIDTIAAAYRKETP